jgi:hypothetical protein
MPTEYRRVQVAPGHTVTVRRVPKVQPRNGKVLVVKSHREPFEVDEAKWNAAEVAHA